MPIIDTEAFMKMSNNFLHDNRGCDGYYIRILEGLPSYREPGKGNKSHPYRRPAHYVTCYADQLHTLLTLPGFSSNAGIRCLTFCHNFPLKLRQAAMIYYI